MSYRVSDQAQADIVHLYAHGVESFGVEQAERYYDGLERVFEFLADYPEAARLRLEIEPAVRVHPYKSHLVVYSIEADRDITILRVPHAREDWERHRIS